MIIISSRKFRDNQNEILRKALTEEVILTTLHYGNFRLVPLSEQENSYSRPSVYTQNSSKVSNSDAPNSVLKQAYSEPVIMVVDAGNGNKSDKVDFEPLKTIDAPQDEAIAQESLDALESSKNAEIQAEKEEQRREREWKDPLSGIKDVEVIPTRTVSLTYQAPAVAPAQIEESNPVEIQQDLIPQAEEGEGKSKRNVYVDPSLLTWEEFLKQEGMEPEQKKKGFFAKLFNKE